MPNKSPALIAGALAIIVAAGCSSDDSSCVPGAQVSCACPGGALGVQVCEASGSSLGACACPEGSDAQLEGPRDATLAGPDATSSAGEDATVGLDTGTPADAAQDAALPSDAGARDAGGMDAGATDAGATDASEACIPFGGWCSNTIQPCCAGTCVGVWCCNQLGEPCAQDHDCCSSIDNYCDPATNRCAPKTCVETAQSENCGYQDIPCCDGRLECYQRLPDPTYRCCAPNGTRLTTAEQNLCCRSVLNNGNGTVTCYSED